MSEPSVTSPARSWADALLGFFYPEACQICHTARATPAEGYVCAACWQGVRFIKPPFCDRCGLPYPGDITTVFECGNCRGVKHHFRSARSAVAAEGVVLEVIHQYKYQRALWFEPFLADLLIRAAKPELQLRLLSNRQPRQRKASAPLNVRMMQRAAATSNLYVIF